MTASNLLAPTAQQIEATRRSFEADEILRARAEGYGRPIISSKMNGLRSVTVGTKTFNGTGWRFFTDFLLYYMKEALGPGWIKHMQSRSKAHPLFHWLDELQVEQENALRRADQIVSVRGSGSVLSIFRFAYALYLIAHHDQIPPPLIRRLRKPSEFIPALTETFCVAAFALAGFKIEMSETCGGKGPEGEFRATSNKTGKVFNVEAKRRNGWQSTVAVDNVAFQRELKLWLKRKLYDAARKSLENPIYWFELSLPNFGGAKEAEQLQELVRSGLREAEEEIFVNGKVPAPAYVFVSSHSYLANEKSDETTLFMLDGFHIGMLEKGKSVEVEQALIERDRDRDMVWVLECLQKVQHVPHRFDGTPDKLVGIDYEPIGRLKIGQRLEVILPDAGSVKGLVTQVISHGSSAHVVLTDEHLGVQNIVELPLNNEEQVAAANLGDAVFGNPNGSRQIPDDDSLGLYDFFLNAYALTPHDKLLEFLALHPNFESFKSLSTEDLRIRLCREWMKSALSH